MGIFSLIFESRYGECGLFGHYRRMQYLQHRYHLLSFWRVNVRLIIVFVIWISEISYDYPFIALWIASSAPVDFNWVSNDSKTTGSAKELANAADALTTAFHIIFTILVVGRLMYLRRRLGRLAGELLLVLFLTTISEVMSRLRICRVLYKFGSNDHRVIFRCSGVISGWNHHTGC